MFKKIILKNGLRVITLPLKNTKALTFLVLVGIGSKYEEKSLNGISHLLEHMIFKGTAKRPKAIDIAEQLDRIGGVYNAFTSKEYMGFWVKVDSAHYEIALDILSDIIFNSQMEEKNIILEKKVVLEEINMVRDNPQSYIFDLWEELLYGGDQPAGWPILGTKASLGRIARKDLLAYAKKQFNGENAVVVAAGDFSGKKISAAVEKYFAPFGKRKSLTNKKIVEAQKKPCVLLHSKETGQVHLCLGQRAFGLGDKRRYAMAVLSTLLGGIMSSRLFVEVREKRGLAYYIHTFPQYYTDSGYLVTSAGVDSARAKEAIKVILGEYRRLRDENVPENELAKAKENIKGKLRLSLETSDSWASFLGMQEILENKIFLPDYECAMIDKVKVSDVASLAANIFRNDGLNLALIGNFKEKREFEKILTL